MAKNNNNDIYGKLKHFFEDENINEYKNLCFRFDKNVNYNITTYKCHATMLENNKFLVEGDLSDDIYNNYLQIDGEGKNFKNKAVIVEKEEFLKIFMNEIEKDIENNNLNLDAKDSNINKIMNEYSDDSFLSRIYIIDNFSSGIETQGISSAEICKEILQDKLNDSKTWDNLIDNFSRWEIRKNGKENIDFYNSLDENGKTALDIAIKNGDILKYHALSNCGAVRGVEIENGKNVLSKREEILELLKNNASREDKNAYLRDPDYIYNPKDIFYRQQDISIFIRENIENGNLSFEDLKKYDIEHYVASSLRFCVDKDNQTIFDLKHNFYCKERIDDYLSSDFVKMYNYLKNNFSDFENEFSNKNFNIGGKDVFYAGKDNYFINGTVDENLTILYNSYVNHDNRFSMDKYDFLQSLTYEIVKNNPDIDYNNISIDKMKEIFNNQNELTAGDKIDMIINGDNKYDINSSYNDCIQSIIVSELDSKTWDNLINDGSIEKMINSLGNNSEYLNILDKNGETVLDVAIKNNDIELSDKLMKVNVLTKEELDQYKDTNTLSKEEVAEMKKIFTKDVNVIDTGDGDGNCDGGAAAAAVKDRDNDGPKGPGDDGPKPPEPPAASGVCVYIDNDKFENNKNGKDRDRDIELDI